MCSSGACSMKKTYRNGLIRQLLTESIVLALVGGLLGVLFAYWGSRFLVMLMSRGQPITLDVQPDILIGAGLFVRTFDALRHLNPGFNRENVLLFSINPTEQGYQGGRFSLYKQLLQRIDILPGVRTASMSFLTPIEGSVWNNSVFVDGYRSRTDENMDVYINSVGPEFFKTLGVPLLLGRDFGSQDTEKSSRVAVINETMARSFFGNGNPIGRRFGWGTGKEREEFEVVGIVGDAKYKNLREKIHRTAYLYCFQMPQPPEEIHFEVRAVGNLSTLVSQIRNEVRSIDKSLSISEVGTLDEQVNRSLLQERLIATLASFFSILALLLASIGLCGVMMYVVVRRTNEIGIRMALGAQQNRVLWMVLRETSLLVAIGLTIGIASALATTRLVSSMLFGVTPTDPLTIAAVTLLLVAVAGLAAYIPARKASRIDPVVALRYE
jgi:predicted permease